MSETLQEKKQKIELMQLEMNILKLEARSLELDEEKILLATKMKEQQERLDELKSGSAPDE